MGVFGVRAPPLDVGRVGEGRWAGFATDVDDWRAGIARPSRVCAMAQTKPASSRVTVTTATTDFLCRATKARYRSHRRIWAFQAISVMALGWPCCRARMDWEMQAGNR